MGTSFTAPINLADLPAHIQQLQDNNSGRKSFRSEFLSIGGSWYYDDGCGYDDAHTRVILPRPTSVPGVQQYSESDGINANWIDDPHGERRVYIATQCPTSSTVGDFYRMVREYNVHQIIMLASQSDLNRGRCYKYFPDSHASEVEAGGDISVSLYRTESRPGFIIRECTLKDKAKGISRQLIHYHFDSWPDLDVPSDPRQLLNLILAYRSRTSDVDVDAGAGCRRPPIVVHCGAGLGRTGTFILADGMYQMARDKRRVDFYGYLRQIRSQRVCMVEVWEQYRLAYKVIGVGVEMGLFKEDGVAGG